MTTKEELKKELLPFVKSLTDIELAVFKGMLQKLRNSIGEEGDELAEVNIDK